MDLSHLPVVDWDLATKLAGNKKDLAEEMLDLLMKSLPVDTTTLTELHKTQNYPELLKLTHRLHGALCYCGLPRLKTIIAHLETSLKNNIMIGLPSLFDQLNNEVNLLLEYHSRLISHLNST